jgi:hypothetical protein
MRQDWTVVSGNSPRQMGTSDMIPILLGEVRIPLSTPTREKRGNQYSTKITINVVAVNQYTIRGTEVSHNPSRKPKVKKTIDANPLGFKSARCHKYPGDFNKAQNSPTLV